jgi:hypothetical protein
VFILAEKAELYDAVVPPRTIICIPTTAAVTFARGWKFTIDLYVQVLVAVSYSWFRHRDVSIDFISADDIDLSLD